MKRLMVYLKEQKAISEENVADFKVGQGVKWNPQEVSDYIDIQACGGMDHGEIIEVGTNTFTVRCNNGNEVKVKKEHVYAFGNDDSV